VAEFFQIDLVSDTITKSLNAFTQNMLGAVAASEKLKAITSKINKENDDHLITVRKLIDNETELTTVYRQTATALVKLSETYRQVGNDAKDAAAARKAEEKAYKDQQKALDRAAKEAEAARARKNKARELEIRQTFALEDKQQREEQRRLDKEMKEEQKREKARLKTKEQGIRELYKWVSSQEEQQYRESVARAVRHNKEMERVRKEANMKRRKEIELTFKEADDQEFNANAAALIQRTGGKVTSVHSKQTLAQQASAYSNELKRAIENEKRMQAALERTKQRIVEVIFQWQTLARVAAIHQLYRVMYFFEQQLQRSVHEAVKLEKALAEIQTISQSAFGNTESTKAWVKAARDISSAFGLDLFDTVEGAYEALSNQVIKTTEDFRIFGTEVAQFAITSQTTTAKSVNLLSSYMNAYGTSLRDVDQIAASTFKTIELGRVRAEEFADSIGRISVPAAELGVNMHELNSLISLATVRGIKFSEAATQIRGVLNKLIKPTDEMKEFFKEIGVESGEAAVQLFGAANVIRMLGEYTKGSQTQLAKLFPDIRGLNLALLLQGKGMEDYESILQQTIDSTEYYERATEIALDNIGKKFDQERERAANYFRVEAGREMLKVFSLLTNEFKLLTPASQLFVATIKAMIGAAGLAGLVRITMAANAAFLALRAQITNTTLAVAALNRGFAAMKAFFLSNPFGATFAAATVALTLLISASGAYGRSLDSINQKYSEQIQLVEEANLAKERSLRNELQNLEAQFTREFNLYNQRSSRIIGIIRGEINERKKLETELFKTIGENMDSVSDRVKKLAESTRHIITKMSQDIRSNINRMFELHNDTGSTIFNWNLEGASAKEQIDLIQKRLAQLAEARRKSTNVEQLTYYSREIDELSKRLASLFREMRNTDINRPTRQQAVILEKIEKLQARIATQSQRLQSSRGETRNKIIAQLRLYEIEQSKLKSEYDGLQTARRRSEIDQQAVDIQRTFARYRLEEYQIRQRLLEQQKADLRAQQRELEIREERVRQINELTDSMKAFQKRDKDIFDTSELLENQNRIDEALFQKDKARVRELELERQAIKERIIDQEFKKQEENAQRLIEATREMYAARYAEAANIFNENLNPSERVYYQDRLNRIEAEGKTRIAELERAQLNFREMRERELIQLRLEAVQNEANAQRQVFEDRKKAIQDELAQITAVNQGFERAALELKKRQDIFRLNDVARLVGEGHIGGDKVTERSELEKAVSKYAGVKIQGVDNRELIDLFRILGSVNLTDRPLQDIQKSELVRAIDAISRLIDILPDPSTLSISQRDTAAEIENLKNMRAAIQAFIKDGSPERESQLRDQIKEVERQKLEFIREYGDPTEKFQAAVDQFGTVVATLVEKVNGPPTGRGYATGGRVAHSDTVPAWLTPGEFVVRSGPSQKWFSQLTTMNYGLQPRRNDTNSGSNFTFGDLNIDARGYSGSKEELADFVTSRIRTQLQRGVARL
jgi:TP901 family phage tail tape measure protein